MPFYSYSFIFVFLPITLAGFQLARYVGRRAQIIWLTAASFAFYGLCQIRDVPVLGGLMLFTFAVARALQHWHSRMLLAFGIAGNLLTLGYFKYTGFFGGILMETGLTVPWFLRSVALPLGISFFVFQKIAYLVDTYQSKTIRHSFSDYALFVSFFPQLIAGPIVHQAEILRQLRRDRADDLRASDLAIGLTVFSIGLFKKIVLADSFALIADAGFSAAATQADLSLAESWVSVLAYAMQIYFDFSGYSDMAIGLGRLFGIRLPINFNSPYKSLSIIEFWRRWHITLSRFLRDYLYIPLGGNRRGSFRRYGNLMITMLLGGLWHGAAWTFVAWGALHGAFLMINHAWHHFIGPVRSRPGMAASWVCTFLCINIAWVFFRSPSFRVAHRLLKAMLVPEDMGALPEPRVVATLFVGFLIVLTMPNTQEIMVLYRPSLGQIDVCRGKLRRLLLWRPNPVWGIAVGCLLISALIRQWVVSVPPAFIYFNF